MKHFILALFGLFSFTVCAQGDPDFRSVSFTVADATAMNAIPATKLVNGKMAYREDTETIWIYDTDTWKDTGMGPDGVADDQTLAEVLAEGNTANMDIDMNGNQIDNVQLVRIKPSGSSEDMDISINGSGASREFNFNPLPTGKQLEYDYTTDEWRIDGAEIATSSGGTALENVVEDTTPQAGGDFDMQGFDLLANFDFEVYLDRSGGATRAFRVMDGANTQIFSVDENGDLGFAGFVQMTPTDTEPTGVEGGLYFDDSENTLKQYNGTSWEALNGGGSTPTLAEVLTEGNNAGSNDINGVANFNMSGFLDVDGGLSSSQGVNVEGTNVSNVNTLDFTPTDAVIVAVEGNLYADDSENRPKYHDGTSWKAFLLEGDVTGGGTDNSLSEADQAIPDGTTRVVDALGSNGQLSFRQAGTEIMRVGGNNDDALRVKALEGLDGNKVHFIGAIAPPERDVDGGGEPASNYTGSIVKNGSKLYFSDGTTWHDVTSTSGLSTDNQNRINNVNNVVRLSYTTEDVTTTIENQIVQSGTDIGSKVRNTVSGATTATATLSNTDPTKIDRYSFDVLDAGGQWDITANGFVADGFGSNNTVRIDGIGGCDFEETGPNTDEYHIIPGTNVSYVTVSGDTWSALNPEFYVNETSIDPTATAEGNSVTVWNDLSGNGYHVTAPSGAEPVLHIEGSERQVRFATGDKLEAANATILEKVPQTDAWTIAVKIGATIGSGDYEYIISKAGSLGSTRTYTLYYAFGNYVTHAGGTATTWSTTDQEVGDVIVVTYDSNANGLSFYKNGALVLGGQPIGTGQNTAALFNLGSRDGSSGSFNGDLVRAAVFDRVLTPAEIATLD